MAHECKCRFCDPEQFDYELQLVVPTELRRVNPEDPLEIEKVWLDGKEVENCFAFLAGENGWAHCWSRGPYIESLNGEENEARHVCLNCRKVQNFAPCSVRLSGDVTYQERTSGQA